MKQHTKASGFTIIELMIAIAVIAISLVSLLSVIISNIKLDDLSKEMNLATRAANAQIEKWQGVGYNESIKGPLSGQTSIRKDFKVHGLAPFDDGHYEDTSTDDVGFVEIIPEAGKGDNIVDIRVYVEWKGADGNNKRLAVSSKRSDRGQNAVPPPEE